MDETVVTSTTVPSKQQRDDDAEALLEMSRQRIADYRRKGRFVTRISDYGDFKEAVEGKEKEKKTLEEILDQIEDETKK